MIRHAAAALIALTAEAGAAPSDHEALFEAMEIDRTVALMHTESVTQGEEMARDMFPGRVRPDWRDRLERIYDEDAMRDRLRGGMSAVLEGHEVEGMVAFFASDRGRRIVDLELAAREALADEEVEDAARATWDLLPQEDPERADRITRFVEVNDLVEENVEAALNANLEFLRGLREGGAFPEPMSDEEMLAEVWSTEGDVRGEMTDWLGAHLALAYEPLGDADLDAYIAFSGTEDGQLLNRALFAGFDAMYEDVGRRLGLAAAAQMVGQDL